MKLAFGAGLLVVTALLAGCGGDDKDKKDAAPPASAPAVPSASTPVTSSTGSPPTPPPATRPSRPAPQVSASFVACMRSHGVKIPDQGEKWTPPPASDQVKIQKALSDCMRSLSSPPPQ
ncbi:hypothetical protein [Actinomadura sp. 6N118]|uniref:hypothetical protein n=1 Tax=Actinomadura sp. 6N118 TaxID=3375151 RepID=UPI0037A6F229